MTCPTCGRKMPQPRKPRAPRKLRFCSVEDCDGSHYGKGFCITHYRRWRKHGDPLVVLAADERNHDRDREILRLYLTGLNLQEVGDLYGVSRERVRQIVARQDEKAKAKHSAFNRARNEALKVDRNRTRRRAEKRRNRTRRCKQIDVLRTLYAELGRTPTRWEIGQRMGWPTGNGSIRSRSATATVKIAMSWSGRPSNKRGLYTPAVQRLMRLAGVPYRSLTDSREGLYGSGNGKPRQYDYDRIVALRREGKLYREIAAEIGCHLNTVRRALRRS